MFEWTSFEPPKLACASSTSRCTSCPSYSTFPHCTMALCFYPTHPLFAWIIAASPGSFFYWSILWPQDSCFIQMRWKSRGTSCLCLHSWNTNLMDCTSIRSPCLSSKKDNFNLLATSKKVCGTFVFNPWNSQSISLFPKCLVDVGYLMAGLKQVCVFLTMNNRCIDSMSCLVCLIQSLEETVEKMSPSLHRTSFYQRTVCARHHSFAQRTYPYLFCYA